MNEVETKIKAGDFIPVLDSTGTLLGFICGTKVYDEAKNPVAEIKKGTTVEQVKELLLARKLKSYLI